MGGKGSKDSNAKGECRLEQKFGGFVNDTWWEHRWTNAGVTKQECKSTTARMNKEAEGKSLKETGKTWRSTWTKS